METSRMSSSSVLLILNILMIIINGSIAIINGYLVSSGRTFPYQVSILNKYGDNYCGGVVIDATHILTAGHCVCNTDEPKPRIIAGTIQLNHPCRVMRNVINITLHPEFHLSDDSREIYGQTKFDLSPVDDDIAVLTLDEPLTLGGNIDNVILPTIDLRNEYYKILRQNLEHPELPQLCPPKCFVAGWGENEIEGPQGNLLAFSPMRILRPSICFNKWSAVRSTQLCTLDMDTGMTTIGQVTP